MKPAQYARSGAKRHVNPLLAALVCTCLVLLGTDLAIAEPAADELVGDHAPVRRISIDVAPFYFGAREVGGQPRVAVEKGFDDLLESNDLNSILKFRDAANQYPEHVSPMALMVLAIRLYDLGRRDDAVFWWYAAKMRYSTMLGVLDIQASRLGTVHDAMVAFHSLAGPVINGYAFCDIQSQQRLHSEAAQWAEQHPYSAVFREDFVAKPGDREDNLRNAIAAYRAGMAEETKMVHDPEKVERMREMRRENSADEKFCWTK